MSKSRRKAVEDVMKMDGNGLCELLYIDEPIPALSTAIEDLLYAAAQSIREQGPSVWDAAEAFRAAAIDQLTHWNEEEDAAILATIGCSQCGAYFWANGRKNGFSHCDNHKTEKQVKRHLG